MADEQVITKAMDWRMIALALASVAGMAGTGGAVAGSRLAAEDEPAVVVYRLQAVETQLTGLSVQVQTLQTSIDRRTASQWTREDADQYAGSIDDRLDAIETRMQMLERVR